MKMKDVGIFGRSRLAYGWISAKPKRDWIQKQEQATWKSWAKLTYANARMRRTTIGAHTCIFGTAAASGTEKSQAARNGS